MKHLLFLILTLCVFTACETGTGEELFTRLSVRLIPPDNRPVERLEVLTDISYFENLNTKEKIHFPIMEGRSATVVLPKGVYSLLLDAYVYYSDGSRSLVRADDYNDPAKVVTWIDDESSIALLLKFVK